MSGRVVYRLELEGLDVVGASTTFHYASEGFTTDAAHPARPSQYVAAGLEQPLLMRRDMYGSGGGTRGPVAIAHGEIVLKNAEGSLDGLLAYGFDGQRVRLYKTTSDALNTESLIFQGVTEQMTLSEQQVVFSVRDQTYKFDVAFQPTKFAGTNALPAGLEGVADDIKGHPKPYLIGQVFNVEPVLVNTSRQIYQLHDAQFYGPGSASTGWSLTVYDRRAALTAGALKTLAQFNAAAVLLVFTVNTATDIFTTVAHSYATGDALSFTSTGGTLSAGLLDTLTYYARVLSATTFTAHPTAADAAANTNIVNVTTAGTGTLEVSNNRTALGSYDWCNDAAGFYFRLGSAPVGQVTVDAKNYPPGLSGITLADILAPVVNRIGSFNISNGLPAIASQDMGIYLTEEITCYQVLQRLLQNVNASFGMYANGGGGATNYIMIYRLQEPSGTQVLDLDEKNLLAIPERVTSADPERGIPAWRCNVGYKRNGTVQRAADIAGASAVSLAFVEREYRTKVVETAAVKNQYPSSPEVNFNTELADETAAGLLATYFNDLYKLRRDTLVASIPLSALDGINGAFPTNVPGLTMGDVVRVTIARYGLGSGKLFRLIGQQTNHAAATVELTLWG